MIMVKINVLVNLPLTIDIPILHKGLCQCPLFIWYDGPVENIIAYGITTVVRRGINKTMEISTLSFIPIVLYGPIRIYRKV